MCAYIYSTPPLQAGCDTRSVYKWSKCWFHCRMVAKEPNLSNYSLIAEKTIDAFKPFPRALGQNETETTFSSI